MDVYIYETSEGDYLKLLGLTDRLSSYRAERLICGGDKLEAVFLSDGRSEVLLKAGRIIEIPDVFSGVMIGVKLPRGGGRIEVSAVSFSGLLSRRILVDFEFGDSFMTIIEKNCGSLARAERVFPNTIIDKSEDCAFLPSSAYRKKSISRAVSAVIEKGFRVCSEIIHDDGGSKIRIYGRYTSDLSVSSGAAFPVILSENYDTLGGQSYAYSEKGAVNGAYIYSKEKYNGSGEVGIEAWSRYFGEASGYQRCEESYEIEPVISYSASVIDGELVYSAQLDYSGTKAVADDVFNARYAPPEEVISAYLGNGMTEAFRSGIFQVGDTVTLYPDENGEKSARRITKIMECCDNGGFTMSIYLGNMVKN
ncbi:MAG: hypothetical protein ACI4I1_08480 [Oscillospiraceae bacterium]